MFVVPSLFVGFILAPPSIQGIYNVLFTDDMGLDLVPVPTAFSVFQALAIGILIPILSSIVPIQAAMKKNLNDSLDTQRSKTQASNI